jgi:nucleoside-diphosphate-sugar epimerase
MPSSSPRIFVTGVSGYIGGHTVSLLAQKHPEYTLTLLVRDESQKINVQSRWPDAEIVIGDLDSSELLINVASKSDVVLRKHTPSYTD